jgi:hypothetical protein
MMASRLKPADQNVRTALLVLLGTSFIALACVLAVDIPPLMASDHDRAKHRLKYQL